jgi:hypothetical protein
MRASSSLLTAARASAEGSAAVMEDSSVSVDAWRRNRVVDRVTRRDICVVQCCTARSVFRAIACRSILDRAIPLRGIQSRRIIFS